MVNKTNLQYVYKVQTSQPVYGTLAEMSELYEHTEQGTTRIFEKHEFSLFKEIESYGNMMGRFVIVNPVIDDKKFTYEMDLLSPQYYLISHLSLPRRIVFVFSLPEISFYTIFMSQNFLH